MLEGIKSNSVVNEARKKAIEKVCIPEKIRKSYHVSIKCGKAILSKKMQKKSKSLTVIIKDKLKETFEWFVPPNYIPSNKKLYYEALRIQKAINNKNK